MACPVREDAASEGATGAAVEALVAVLMADGGGGEGCAGGGLGYEVS